MSEIDIEGYPLSPQQRVLWKLDGEEDRARYAAECTVRIRGALDRSALERALDTLSRRHEILRTCFVRLAGLDAPLQVVTDESVRLSCVELESVPPAEQADEIGLRRRRAEERSWDLSKAPLLEACLFSLSSEEWLLSLRAPALLTDERGLVNLVLELGRDYEAALGGIAEVEAAPVQYADLSGWLDDVLSSEDTAEGRDYWRRSDRSSESHLELPFERHASEGRGFAPRSLPLALPAGVASRLGALAAELSVSPPALLLCCFQFLLGRLLRTDRWVVCFGSDGRGYDELKGALGLFRRSLPLAGAIEEGESFAHSVSRVQAALDEAAKWTESFDPSSMPSPAFVYEPLVWPASFSKAGATFDVEELSATTHRFELKLQSHLRSGGLSLALLYDENLFEREEIERLAEHFVALLKDALARPRTKLRELGFLPEAERRFILDEVNRTERSYPDACIHELFEAEVERAAEQLAVRCEGHSLTYRELDARANRLASYLMRMGVRPESRVALCLERSVEMVVAMLAVLKAGGAYVPLEPQMPKLRSAAMLEDSGAEILISTSTGRASAPEPTGALVLLDEIEEALERESGDAVVSGVRSSNLAYVLFTSGSTGRPKGVAIEHRHLTNHVSGIRESFELGRDRSFAFVSTFAADLGNTSIYGALTTGGELHVIPERIATDPDAYASYCRENPIDVLKIVPSHMEALLSASAPADVLPRRLLVLGGEALSPSLVSTVSALKPECRVVNEYGPTETTVAATYHVVGAEPAAYRSGVPIGRPLPNCRAYVLDEGGSLVPTWVEGELHVGGASVARGYLGAPELTRERFLPDPFSTEPGARLYRTGDRARLLPTGELEFLGRADDQVTVRGYRIELGEVEAALRRHEDVQKSAVVVREDAASEKRLVAYVVPAAGRRADPVELREFLKDALPAYMIPVAFVALASLPLNSNGKLDRQRLPAPDEPAASGPSLPPEEPRTRWESVVADVWRELLSVDRVSAQDNFYDLGGHSLLAIRVVRELEKRTGLKVSPRELVFHTLRQFAAVCAAKTPLAG